MIDILNWVENGYCYSLATNKFITPPVSSSEYLIDTSKSVFILQVLWFAQCRICQFRQLGEFWREIFMQSFQFLIYNETDVKSEKRRWKIEQDLEAIMDGNYLGKMKNCQNVCSLRKLSNCMNDSNFNAGKLPKTDM